MSRLLGYLASMGAWAYVAEGLVVFAEDALFFGFVLPGETVLVFCAFLAQQHVLDPAVVFVVAAFAAVLGDQTGFEIGRRFGWRIEGSRPGRRLGASRWELARSLVEQRGGASVFVGRWAALLRALVPTTCGMLGMPRWEFTKWNTAGGVLWAGAWTAVGYLAGASWERVAKEVGEIAAIVAVALLGALIWAGLRASRGRGRA